MAKSLRQAYHYWQDQPGLHLTMDQLLPPTTTAAASAPPTTTASAGPYRYCFCYRCCPLPLLLLPLLLFLNPIPLARTISHTVTVAGACPWERTTKAAISPKGETVPTATGESRRHYMLSCSRCPCVTHRQKGIALKVLIGPCP